MDNKTRKILAEIPLPGTGDIDNPIVYTTYKPIDGIHDIFNAELPKKEQKWIRPSFPNFSALSKKECQEIYIREIKRIKHGVYVWINGTLTYLPGKYYFYLTHWKLKESDSDYAIYTVTQRNLFYFFDLCDKDKKCVGAIVFSCKRLGKSEMAQAEMFADALLSDSGRYIVQALNDDEAIAIFEKTHYANESLHESLPIWKYKFSKTDPPDENLVPFSRATKTDSITWKSIDGADSRDTVQFNVRPTKLAGIQGKKIKRGFLDEFASLEPKKDMTLKNWHSKAIAQSTENAGNTVKGKIWLIATAENITSGAIADAQDIWDLSAEDKKTANGFTISKLRRMFIDTCLGGRDEFIDEYGTPLYEKYSQVWQNEFDARPDAERALYVHENPRTIEHVFDLNREGGLEADVKEIIKLRKEELKTSIAPLFDITKYNNEIKLTPTKKEGQFTIEMFEDVKEHHVYRVGLDGTSSAKNSTNKKANGEETGNTKSKYAVVVSRLSGDDGYVDVANYFVRPEKRYLAEKVALWLCEHYNKYGKCRGYPERNASAGSTLTDLFEAEGKQRILIRQLKHHNTDKLDEKKGGAYGIYIDGPNKDYRTSIMNKAGRLFGHRINSKRLCENLLIYGSNNADLADAWGVMTMAWGNFDPDTQKERKQIEEKPKEERLTLKMVDGKLMHVWE